MSYRRSDRSQQPASIYVLAGVSGPYSQRCGFVARLYIMWLYLEILRLLSKLQKR
jgi:uncharacterized YccA/Bax inhibitor family protein